jgi:hypothetical protein
LDKINEQKILSSEADIPLTWDSIEESFIEDNPELYWGNELPNY